MTEYSEFVGTPINDPIGDGIFSILPVDVLFIVIEINMQDSDDGITGQRITAVKWVVRADAFFLEFPSLKDSRPRRKSRRSNLKHEYDIIYQNHYKRCILMTRNPECGLKSGCKTFCDFFSIHRVRYFRPKLQWSQEKKTKNVHTFVLTTAMVRPARRRRRSSVVHARSRYVMKYYTGLKTKKYLTRT